MWYKTFLPKLHQVVAPERYVEIGIRHGYSLSLSPKAKKIAIDPTYGAEHMQFEVAHTTFFRLTSDKFFETQDLKELMPEGFDLGYIDGLHLFEFALRDFINLERFAAPGGVVIVDDVIPRTEAEAARKASGGSWAGDVWKLVECFRTYRPELLATAMLTRSEPTGCLILTAPDRSNRVLSERYNEILARFTDAAYPTMPSAEFHALSVDPQEALDRLQALRSNSR